MRRLQLDTKSLLSWRRDAAGTGRRDVRATGNGQFIAALAILFFALVTFPLRATEVTVFAAISLSDALKEIAANYEKQSGDKIIFNFAGSGSLARQIAAGVPVDIFFSADDAKADMLEQKGLLVKGTRQSRLSNTLVLITTPDNSTIHSPADLTNSAVQRIAIGDNKTVPAGAYAQTYFEKIGLWPAIQPKTVPCESVRAVLAAVESGNVDAGVVYKTDAAISRKVKVVFEVPEGPKISYPMAMVTNAPHPDAARQFLAYLSGNEAGAVFARHNFIVLREGAKR